MPNELYHITLLNLPCVIIGDFNTIYSISKHKDGKFSYHSHKTFLFNELISKILYMIIITWALNLLGIMVILALLISGQD